MAIMVGELVEIPEYLDNYDVDENAKVYGNWFFENHFDWLHGMSIRWAEKNPITTWEDCLRVCWERLPLILAKFRFSQIKSIKYFVREQLKWYWVTDAYRKIKDDRANFEKYCMVSEVGIIQYGLNHAEFDTIEQDDYLERHGIEKTLYCIEDKSARSVLYAIIVLGLSYRDIAKSVGCSIGTIANMVSDGLTEIYKSNPQYYHEQYLLMRSRIKPKPRYAKPQCTNCEIAHNETNADATTAQARELLQRKIAEYIKAT